MEDLCQELEVDMLNDKANELVNLRKEIELLKSDYTMRPSRKHKRLKELRETIMHCREEYNELAHDILTNHL